MKKKGFTLDDRSIECPPLSPRLLKLLREERKKLRRKEKDKNEKNNKQNDGSKGSWDSCSAVCYKGHSKDARGELQRTSMTNNHKWLLG